MSDYNFVPEPPPPPAIDDEITEMSKELIKKGTILGVQSIVTGALHKTIQSAAQSHADFQAHVRKMGHQTWDDRWRALAKIMPEAQGFREVVAYVWGADDIATATTQIFNSWRGSPPHWQSVDGQCSFYGYAFSRDDKGVWYACGIFADKK